MNKELKYDRQLRLWATQGQQLLESSKVIVIQPTITSLELLKNLVLPGIGSFTLMDVKKNVDDNDMCNNFYLKEEDAGGDKCEALRLNMNELNEDVSSDFVHVTNVRQWLDTARDDWWTGYDLVVMSYEYPYTINQLKKLGIPLIVTNTYGFYGFLRLFKRTYEVIETHAQGVVDLRILEPWKELQEYVDSFDLQTLDLETHAQVPYLVIQIKAIAQWLTTHDGIPKTGEEKKDFKRLILSWKKDYQELNFDEAFENSHKMFNTTQIPYNVTDIFDKSDQYFNDVDTCSIFWVLVKALRAFVLNNGGMLPLTGDLPDMDSATENYITLKKIYQQKFMDDMSMFKRGLSIVTDSIHWEYKIDDEMIKIFLKNAKHLYFAQNNCLPLSDANVNAIVNDDDNQSNLILMGIHLVQSFILRHGGFPQLSDRDDLTTLSKLKDVLEEIIRSGGMELNNICSIMGGIAGQEAIKLITNQYIPLDNTLVFDGLRSVSERWRID